MFCLYGQSIATGAALEQDGATKTQSKPFRVEAKMIEATAKTITPNQDGVLIAFDIMDGVLVGALDLFVDSNGYSSLVRLSINDDDRKEYAIAALELLEADYGKIKIALEGETLPLLYARLRALNRASTTCTTSNVCNGRN